MNTAAARRRLSCLVRCGAFCCRRPCSRRTTPSRSRRPPCSWVRKRAARCRRLHRQRSRRSPSTRRSDGRERSGAGRRRRIAYPSCIARIDACRGRNACDCRRRHRSWHRPSTARSSTRRCPVRRGLATFSGTLAGRLKGARAPESTGSPGPLGQVDGSDYRLPAHRDRRRGRPH